MALEIIPYKSEAGLILESVYKDVDMQLILIDPAGDDILFDTPKANIISRELTTTDYTRSLFQFTDAAIYDGGLGKWYLEKTTTVTAGTEIIEYVQLVLIRNGANTAPKSISLAPVSNRIVCAGHGLANGDPIVFTANVGATLPAGITVNTLYFALNVTADDFEVSANSLTALTLTGGSGAGYLKYAKGMIVAISTETPSISLMPSNTRDYPVRVYGRGLSI